MNVITPYRCKCDSCGKDADAFVFLGVAIQPPSGWFVYGKVNDGEEPLGDGEYGAVSQFLFCSAECAGKIIDGASALVEIAEHVSNREPPS